MGGNSLQIEPTVKSDPVVLVSNLNNEVPEGTPEWVCAVDAATCLWNLSVNPAKHQAILDAGAVPLLVGHIQKGSEGAARSGPVMHSWLLLIKQT